MATVTPYPRHPIFATIGFVLHNGFSTGLQGEPCRPSTFSDPCHCDGCSKPALAKAGEAILGDGKLALFFADARSTFSPITLFLNSSYRPFGSRQIGFVLHGGSSTDGHRPWKLALFCTAGPPPLCRVCRAHHLPGRMNWLCFARYVLHWRRTRGPRNWLCFAQSGLPHPGEWDRWISRRFTHARGFGFLPAMTRPPELAILPFTVDW